MNLGSRRRCRPLFHHGFRGDQQSGRIDGRALITHTFELSRAKEALAGLVDGTLPAVKAVITP